MEYTNPSKEVARHSVEDFAVDTKVLAYVEVLPMPVLANIILWDLPPLHHPALPYPRVL